MSAFRSWRYLVEEPRILLKVAHLVVPHRRQASSQGGHHPRPLRGALAARALLPQVVRHELLGRRVVVHNGGAVLAERVHDLEA